MGGFGEQRSVGEANAPGHVALRVLPYEALALAHENCNCPCDAEDYCGSYLSGYHISFYSIIQLCLLCVSLNV